MPLIIPKAKAKLPPELMSEWGEQFVDMTGLRHALPEGAPKVEVRSPMMKWRLASAMQKEFRRDNVDRMCVFLAGLAQIDPAYAWRRFAVVVMEDAGTSVPFLHSGQHFAGFLWLSGGKGRRTKHGATTDDLIRYARLFSQGGRDRVVCDANVLTFFDPAWKKHADAVAMHDADDWVKLIAGSPDNLLPWLVMAGEQEYGATAKTAALLQNAPNEYDPLDKWIAVEGVRQRQGGMYSCYPEVCRLDDADVWKSDEMPPHEMIGAYPSYAFDMHVSDGKRAIAYFLAMKSVPFVARLGDLCQWDKAKMTEAFTEFLFWAEAGRLAKRGRRSDGELSLGERMQIDVLHMLADQNGLPKDQVMLLAADLWEAIPQLNYARKRVVQP